MTTQTLPFYDRVESALHNQTLQTALGRATTRFVANRADALEVLIDADGLRDQARAIRAKALARLDELLARLAEQVTALFEQHLGMPPTDDIPTMTQAARRALRQHFMQADMGISGVNFGVADSGAVVLVTNEGNGRLTTTAPRIHVAVMGIERVVESLDDLGVLLQVLARSATGQRLSVYTTIVSGPARPGEPDGPEEFHLVLLDNGRSRILGGQYAEALMCIRCGACLNAC